MEEAAPTARYRVADQQDRSRVITPSVFHPAFGGLGAERVKAGFAILGP